MQTRGKTQLNNMKNKEGQKIPQYYIKQYTKKISENSENAKNISESNCNLSTNASEIYSERNTQIQDKSTEMEQENQLIQEIKTDSSMLDESKTDNSILIETTQQQQQFNMCELNEDTLRITRYLQEIEVVQHNYSEEYKELRTVSVDWIVTSSLLLNLDSSTLFLSIQLFDIYISKYQSYEYTQENFNQILGTILYTSSKYSECIQPQLLEFSTILQIDSEQILKIEEFILISLGFIYSKPTSWEFLEQYQSQIHLNEYQICLSKYLIHLPLYDSSFKNISYSKIAAATVLLVLKIDFINKINVWNEDLYMITGYEQYQLENIAYSLYILLIQIQENKQSAIFQKFQQPIFFSISEKIILK